jgi:hypothetical protein
VELRPVVGTPIVAQDGLNLNTASQPGRRLKFHPGGKCLFPACGHPFRLGPVGGNCPFDRRITEIIDGHQYYNLSG